MPLALLVLALLQEAPITADNAGKVKQTALLSGHAMPVFGLAISPDGKWLASAGIDQTVRLWDLGTGKQDALFKHEKQAIALAFSADGAQLISAGYEPAIRIWDLKTRNQIEEQKKSTTELQFLQVGTCNNAFSADGSRLAYTLEGSWQVYLWDVKTRAQKELKTGRDVDERFARAAFSADGNWMAAQHERPKGGRSSIQIWSVKDDRWTGSLSGPEKAFYSNEAIALNADGSKAACVDVRTSEVQLWDVKSGKPGPALRGHKHDADNEQIMIFALDFSPDGRVLASASYDGTVRLWDTSSGKELVSLPSHKGQAAAVVFSRDGRRLASADLGGTIQVWGVR